MNQKEAEQIYLHHVDRTNVVLESMGDNPQKINAFITNTYAYLAKENPTFIWFSLGTIVSSKVGDNLQFAMQAIIHSAGQADSAKVILKNFAEGNQAVFKDILPLFLTYEDIGIEGIELLKKSTEVNPFQNKSVLEAMKSHSMLKNEQSKIANSLGLPLNESKVIEKLFSNKNNIEIVHNIGMKILEVEQTILQDMYKQDLVDILLDPTLSWVGQLINLSEVPILGKGYKFSDYIENPADINQRIALGNEIFNAIENGIIN